MNLRTRLLSDAGVIGAGIVLTLIVLAESVFPPWAPYFVLYAFLAIIIPVLLRTYQFGVFGTVLRTHWRLILGIFAIAVIWDTAIASWLYERVLAGFGVSGDPFYSLDAALEVLADTAARKFGITFDAAFLLYGLFIVIWAPVGEELFYRGYMQGVLRQSKSFKVSALVSAGFFGIRHATHFFFLWPNLPLVAAGSWVVSTFVFGLLMSYLYEKTHSLYPPMIVHVGVNLVEMMLSV
jgi:membrane protease YdiL (CAAX protease family)